MLELGENKFGGSPRLRSGLSLVKSQMHSLDLLATHLYDKSEVDCTTPSKLTWRRVQGSNLLSLAAFHHVIHLGIRTSGGLSGLRSLLSLGKNQMHSLELLTTHNWRQKLKEMFHFKRM